jgi:hypothetical protein
MVIMVLASFTVPGGLAHPAPSAGAKIQGSEEPGASVLPITAVVPQVSASSTSTCQAQNGSGGTPGTPTVPTSPHPALTGPSPLFNSQVEPFASVTGPYAYVSAGAALRDQGYGLVNLTWPGAPSTSNLVAAYMIWSIINDSAPPAYATLNGVNLTGTWTAFATPSPCWAPTYIYTFAADVTNDVVNGVNNVTGVPTVISNGLDPWTQTQNSLLDEGASLVAIYEPSASTNIHQVTVYTGALPVTGTGPVATLDYGTTNSTTATTTYIVADGQVKGNSAVWNTTTIDANAFPGDDPHESKAVWSYGNLSDTKTYNVSVVLGSNSTPAQVSTSGSDCVTWVGQVLSVGVAPAKGPYRVVFSEQGLPNGTTWNVTTHSTTRSGTVVAAASSIAFTLANNTYTYTVGSIPGYISSGPGSFKVLGGPVFLRVIFHALLYPVTFTETGLPTSVVWWAQITNTSQGVSTNITAYTPATIAYLLGNGTFQYTAGEQGLYLAKPSSGTFVVSGAATLLTITFVPPPLFNITFVEHNLPVGASWGGGVITNFGYSYNRTTNATFSVYEPNSTGYSDVIYPYYVPGFVAPSSVYFTVVGQAESVDVNFSAEFTVQLNQTGLPASTYWYADLASSVSGYFSGYSDGANMTFSVVNGSYTFSISAIWGYTATPSVGPVTVAGATVYVSIVFSIAPNYTLTFNETGVAPGAQWSVKLLLPDDVEIVQNSTSSSLSFLEPNGTYSFYPSATGYTPTPSSGYFMVSGGNVWTTVSFTQVFVVDFDETGLPSGTYWYADLSYYYSDSDSSTVAFSVANGTYSFTIFPVGSYTASPASGSLTVNGANVIETIAFTSPTAPTVAVTFTETGLAPLTNWSVDLNGYLETSIGTTVNFTEANGTFDFQVGGASSYTAAPPYGSLTVQGTALNEPISFSTTTPQYLVTFTESGLPTGSTWYVNVTGQAGLSATVSGSEGTSVEIDLENATYTYEAATSSTSWTTPGNGQFTVNGAALAEPVPFTSTTTPTFSVTFTETGLPTGATWYVNVSGQPSLAATVSGSSGTTVAAELPDGSYDYDAATNNPSWTTPASGDFTVAGAALNEPVPFTSTSTAQYAVTFTETSLPSGSTWYINISGEPGLSATVSGSSGTTVSIDLPNAGYSYTASTSASGWTTPSHGSFTVAGAALSEPVPFTSTSVSEYLLTFTETGLPSGATWYVNITGQPALAATVAGSSGSILTIRLPNGNYPYGAATNWKNWTTSSGTVSVDGAAVDRTVAFTSAMNSSNSASSLPIGWIAGGALVLILLLALLLILLARRRKKKEPPTPTAPTGAPTGAPTDPSNAKGS